MLGGESGLVRRVACQAEARSRTLDKRTLGAVLRHSKQHWEWFATAMVSRSTVFGNKAVQNAFVTSLVDLLPLNSNPKAMPPSSYIQKACQRACVIGSSIELPVLDSGDVHALMRKLSCRVIEQNRRRNMTSSDPEDDAFSDPGGYKDFRIGKWVRLIRKNEAVLPRFQRSGGIWDTEQKKKLLMSILENRPIGVLMGLECGKEETIKCRNFGKIPASSSSNSDSSSKNANVTSSGWSAALACDMGTTRRSRVLYTT